MNTDNESDIGLLGEPIKKQLKGGGWAAFPTQTIHLFSRGPGHFQHLGLAPAWGSQPSPLLWSQLRWKKVTLMAAAGLYREALKGQQQMAAEFLAELKYCEHGGGLVIKCPAP